MNCVLLTQMHHSGILIRKGIFLRFNPTAPPQNTFSHFFLLQTFFPLETLSLPYPIFHFPTFYKDMGKGTF